MLGLRSPKKLVMFLVAVSLTLLSAAILAAQTPTALLDKPAVESSAAMPDAPSKVPATPVATVKEALPKPAEIIAAPEAAPPVDEHTRNRRAPCRRTGTSAGRSRRLRPLDGVVVPIQAPSGSPSRPETAHRDLSCPAIGSATVCAAGGPPAAASVGAEERPLTTLDVGDDAVPCFVR